ncbi:MAG: hypothetical protein JJT76_04160 [Clostridiaceae bacterium]|nr:hypothetical protein [Clostridiaceae bacterium]
MSKNSKVSSVANRRIHNSYVHRATVVDRSEAVEAIDPIKATKNQTNLATANYLISSDLFYDHMDALRKEYKNFYHDHRKLQEAVEDFKKEDRTLVEHMENLIEKYNAAIGSLQILDKEVGTKYLEIIKEIVLEFQEPLESVGIEIKKGYEMYLQENVFIEKIQSLEEPLAFLFEPMKGMVIRLYKVFRSIKIPNRDDLENPQKKYKDTQTNIVGAVVDHRT